MGETVGVLMAIILGVVAVAFAGGTITVNKEVNADMEAKRVADLKHFEDTLGQKGDRWSGSGGTRNGKWVYMIVFTDYFTVAEEDLKSRGRQDILDLISRHGPILNSSNAISKVLK